MKKYIKLPHILLMLVMFAGILFMPVCVSAATIIDDDTQIISEIQREVLEKKCDKIYSDYGVSVIIWTDKNIGMSDNFDYKMERYVREAGAGDDVAILLIGLKTGDRVYEVQGYGKAEKFINSKRCTSILDAMEDDMRSGEYFSAIDTYCSLVERYMQSDPKFDSIVYKWWFQLIVCLVIAGIIIGCMAINSGGKVTVNNNTYLDAGNSRILGSFDRYTHTTTTRVAKPKDNGSSGGSGGDGGGHSSGGGRSF